MTIGEVAAKAGLRPSAIRYSESAGILPAPDRVFGRRVYREDALARLAVLQFAKAGSFSIREIRELDALALRVESMKRVLREALRCGCVDVEECGRAIRKPALRTVAPVRR